MAAFSYPKMSILAKAQVVSKIEIFCYIDLDKKTYSVSKGTLMKNRYFIPQNWNQDPRATITREEAFRHEIFCYFPAGIGITILFLLISHFHNAWCFALLIPLGVVVIMLHHIGDYGLNCAYWHHGIEGFNGWVKKLGDTGQ